LNPELASQKRVHEVGPRFARLLVVKINTTLQNSEVTEIAASVLALALVLPILGGVIYGFETEWDALGFSALGVMALLMSAYYLILRVMLRYRQKFTENA
jgi:hypothetical protein